jgi:hypothetical protein
MPRITVDRGPITTVWLDRADKRNAMDADLMKELAAAFDDIGADRSVRVVVLPGRGSVFSRGIDHTLPTPVFASTAGWSERSITAHSTSQKWSRPSLCVTRILGVSIACLRIRHRCGWNSIFVAGSFRTA